MTSSLFRCVLQQCQVRTDMKALEATLDKLGAENVLCVLSTTSCFAPRAPDRYQH
jgi:O-phospho-L-seryl-tRNASec:L-selenocysteinyl-tRNA synthase